MQAVAHSSWVFCHGFNADAFVLCSAKGFWTGEGWAAVLPDAKRFATRSEADRERINRGLVTSTARPDVLIAGVRRV